MRPAVKLEDWLASRFQRDIKDIEREDMELESWVLPIPLESFLGAALAPLAVTETAGTFHRVLSTNVVLLQGEEAISETEASVIWAQIVLPGEYEAGTNLTLSVVSQVVTGSGTNDGSKFDVSAYAQALGVVGSDICATDEQALAVDDTWEALDFTITGTGLTAGDVLNIKITGSAIESGGSALHLQISEVIAAYSARG